MLLRRLDTSARKSGEPSSLRATISASMMVGALLALRVFGMDLSLIAVIGLLMLIGIVKKNAIMMIDVALTTQREGKDPATAIYEAALLRFRPIMMTTLAALFGVLPIALGVGPERNCANPWA